MRTAAILIQVGLVLSSVALSMAADAPPTPHFQINTLEQGLVVFYQFKNNVLDSSPNGNHGTAFGPVSYLPEGRDLVIRLNNPPGDYITTYVTVPSSPSVQALQNQSFTTCIRYASHDDGPVRQNGRLLGSDQISLGGRGIAFIYNSMARDYAYSEVSDGTKSYTLASAQNSHTTDGIYHWQILIVDRANLRVKQYIDTNNVASATFTSLASVGLTNMVIGATSAINYGGGQNSYGARDMNIDEFRLYDRALTLEEVYDLVSGRHPDPLMIIISDSRKLMQRPSRDQLDAGRH